jgi:hypothetical protein
MPNLFLTTHFSFIIFFIRVLVPCFIGFEQPPHMLRCITLLIVHGMPIAVTGNLYRAMAQNVAYRLQGHSLGE